jgi:hypothetical protein
MALTRLLIDPDTFFERHHSDPGLAGPVATVTAAALATTLSIAVVLARFSAAMSNPDRPLVLFGFGVGLLMAFLTIYLGWVGVAALAYGLLTRVPGTDPPEFRTLFRVLGWGYLPSIVSGLVSALAAAVVYGSLPVPSDPSALSAMVAGVADSPVFTVSTTAVVACSLWQGGLWAIAIRHTAAIPIGRAGLVSAVPTGAVVVMQVLLA